MLLLNYYLANKEKEAIFIMILLRHENFAKISVYRKK